MLFLACSWFLYGVWLFSIIYILGFTDLRPTISPPDMINSELGYCIFNFWQKLGIVLFLLVLCVLP